MITFSHNSKKWRKRSKDILARDKHTCQYFKRYGKRIDATVVHHIYPVEEYPEYAYCGWNLISLSVKAHNIMHDRTTGKLTAEGMALQQRTEPKRRAYERSRRGTPPGSDI